MQKETLAVGTYSLKQTPQEIQRLLIQGQMLNHLTRRVLEEAGITAGMKVLDVGCGPGDVSLIAAELVGETGSVLGVDANADILPLAQARAVSARLKQVIFQAGDIRSLPLDHEYDAIVGRLILEHLPDYPSLLKRLVEHLRPGGVIAFQEYDMVGADDASLPHSPLYAQACRWVVQTFQKVGVETRMGMKLHSTFVEAGLPAPTLRYEAVMGEGPTWAGYGWIADVVRTLQPLMLKFGVATAEEIQIDTLADRIREEAVSQGSVVRMPALVAAWARKS